MVCTSGSQERKVNTNFIATRIGRSQMPMDKKYGFLKMIYIVNFFSESNACRADSAAAVNMGVVDSVSSPSGYQVNL